MVIAEAMTVQAHVRDHFKFISLPVKLSYKEAHMKTSIKQILNARETLSRLAGRTLPVKQSYRLAKLVKAVNDELNVYDGERIKLCEKYGTLNKEKHIYEFEDEAYKSFETDINVLQSQEVELDIKLIDISDLELSAQDIISIEPFIEVITDD